MHLYVGVTDYDWFLNLSAQDDLDEVNFWSPGGAAFRALQPNELFLFKLKAPHGHMIVGGGLFAHDTRLPLSLAWDAFGPKNGAASLGEMASRVRRYQSPEARLLRDPAIGCRLVQQPFFLPRESWFRVPEAFPVNTVSGKTYSTDERDGAWLFQAVEQRLPWNSLAPWKLPHEPGGFEEPGRRYGTPQLVMPRLGQGSFRVTIMDGFDRRCAITGERTLPILDAAHIRPWSAGGENRPGNGVLLRTDIHRLFDLGYVTISTDHRFEVSPRLKEDYEKGRHYYELHGQRLRPPRDSTFLPEPEALAWHHNNRWAKPGAILGI
jgi:putative restriction endonuclease